MSVVKGCVVAAVALAAGALSEAARADEAYVCDAGRIVYVRPGELELKKLQDPCIAKYFENTPAAKPVVAKPAAVVATQAPAASSAEPKTVAAIVAVAPAAPVKPRAEPVIGDYRNVRIINAAPGTEAWFRPRF